MTNKIQFKDIIEEKKEEMKLQEEKEKEIARKEVEEELKEEGFTNIELKEQPFEEIKNSEGKSIEMISLFNKEYNDFSKEQIEKGSSKLEELIQKRDNVEKKLNSIIERNDSLFDKFFQLVKATKQEQRDCVYYLTKKEEQEEDYLKKYLDEETLEKAQTRDELIENITKKAIKDEIKDKENIVYYKYKNFNPEKAKSNDFTKILDEQLFLTSDTLEGMKEAQSILVEFYNLSEKYSIFDFETDENHNITNIIRDEKANQEAIDLYFKIGEETTKAIEINKSFSILGQKKGIQNIFPFDLLEQEKNEIQELKMTLQEKENLQKIETFKPFPTETAIVFNDKLSNNFPLLENNKFLPIGKTGGNGKKVKNSVMRVLIQNGEMTTTRVLDTFDKVILQSIYSITQKNSFFDIQMIKEHITGIKNRHKGKLDEEIEQSINKLRTTLIQIELPEELQKQMKIQFDRVGVKDNILPIREYYVIKGGQKKSAFGFTSKSIYYEYEEARGQLITKNPKLLQGGIGNATRQTIILTDYLSNRIEDMKHQQEKNKKNNYSQEIKFETIWSLILTEEDLKMKTDSLQKKKRRYIEDIETIMKTYKKDNYIKNYEKYSEGIKIFI